MQLILRDDLAFVSVTVVYLGRSIEVPDVIVDTGSATTLLSSDYLAHIGVAPRPQDVLYTIRGVGGTEVVFSRRVDSLQIADQVDS